MEKDKVISFILDNYYINSINYISAVIKGAFLLLMTFIAFGGGMFPIKLINSEKELIDFNKNLGKEIKLFPIKIIRFSNFDSVLLALLITLGVLLTPIHYIPDTTFNLYRANLEIILKNDNIERPDLLAEKICRELRLMDFIIISQGKNLGKISDEINNRIDGVVLYHQIDMIILEGERIAQFEQEFSPHRNINY